MITANEVKSTLRSLRAKINKETGKEHATIAEGVEDLVLGYGIGKGDVWDGKIYVNGEIAKDVKDYFEEGRQAGLEEAERIIIGTFVLGAKQKPVAEQNVTINDVSEVYAYFYNGSTYEKELISSITFSPAEELVSIYSLDRTKFLKYIESDGAWSYSNNEINGELPYGDGVIIAFSEQTLVPGDFYKTFMSAVSEEDAYHEGEQAEYDRFWDAFQDNGNRTDYANAFLDFWWQPDTLRPKYTCKVVQGGSMFARCYWQKPNIVEPMDISHISIDVTEATDCSMMFANANIKAVTLIFGDKITSLNNAFTKGSGDGKPMEITLLVPNPNCDWTNAFAYHNVKELNLLEGTVIGRNGFNVQWATGLSKANLTSIINALSDSTSGLSVTLSKYAVDKAFETSNGANDGSASAEWNALIATKPNWIKNLVY